MAYTNSIIITGGTSGLGYETALILASKYPNNLIIICSRKDNLSAQKINKTLSQKNTIFLPLDLSSTASIRSFVTTFTTTSPPYPPISNLFLNGGIGAPPTFQTNDAGVEKVFATNHLGHALLFFLLKPHLAPKARIILTASSVHDPAQKWDMEEPIYNSAQEIAFPPENSELRKGKHDSWYSTSKLCNIMFTYALSRRLEKEAGGKTVVAFDPGAMPGTGFFGIQAAWFDVLAKWVLPLLIPLLNVVYHRNMHTAKDSARSLAKLAVSGEGKGGENLNGVYYEGTKIIKSSALSYEVNKQEDLWGWTVKNLSADEEEKARFEKF